MKIPKKPKTQKAQIDMMWDFLFNKFAHRMEFDDKRFGFIMALLALILAFMAVQMIRG